MTPGADPILAAIVDFGRKHGRGPRPAEVYAMADFRQPGGIGRLCAALSAFGEVSVQARQHPLPKSRP